MARLSDLTPEVLAGLRSPRPYPAITLAMPTDPAFPMGDKARILLRDLVTEAKRKLADDPEVDRGTMAKLMDHTLDPETIERAGDLLHPEDELVVYLAAGEPVQVWQAASPVAVEPRVEFGTEFLTRYLVAAEQRSRPYLVLVLDKEMCRLYRGTGQRLREVRENGFPDAPQIPSPEDAVPGPIPHAAPYEGHEERVKQYLRTVDGRLGQTLRDHGGMPLFVIGSAKLLSLFKGLSSHDKLIAGTLPLTGMDRDPARDLARRLAPVLDDFHSRQVADALGDLDAARSQGKYAGGPSEVWTAVADRRVRQLIVEEGLAVAGRITGDGRMLEVLPFPEPVTLPEPKRDLGPPAHALGTDTDIVEQLVENAVESGSRVLFVPDGTLGAAGGVAAVLRY